MLQEKFAAVSKEEILQRVAALEFDRFLKYYDNAEDLNLKKDDRATRRPQEAGSFRDTKGRSFGGDNFQKLFINLGTKDGFYKASFLQYILDMSDLNKDVLGRIDMKDLNSWVEIDKSATKQMIKSLDGKSYKGRRIRMNVA